MYGIYRSSRLHVVPVSHSKRGLQARSLKQGSKPYLHTFSIESGADSRVIHAFRGRKMFRYSQDQWFGTIDIHAEWLSGLPLNENLNLVFTVDANDNMDELSESDNQWSGTMVLRASEEDCQ